MRLSGFENYLITFKWRNKTQLGEMMKMLSKVLGTAHGWTIGFMNVWDPQNSFSTKGATVHLLLIVLKQVEILFPVVIFLTTFLLRRKIQVDR